MQRKPFSGTVFMLAILVAGTCCVAGCRSEGGMGAGKAEAQVGPAELSGTMEGSCRVIRVTARRYAFSPNRIVVNEGDNVRLILTSMDVTHGFALKAFDIDAAILPGADQEVNFVADKPGSHEFHCDIYCGIGHGIMHGKLVVIPPEKAAAPAQ